MDTWYYVLSYITDPQDLRSARLCCSLFYQIISKWNRQIKQNPRKIESLVDEYWPELSRSKSISMSFLLSFNKITNLGFPVYVSDFSELCLVGMMEHLKKVTMRLSPKLDTDLLYHFFKDYQNGYVLENGIPIKKNRNLKDVVFKIYRNKTIRWVGNNSYAVIFLDHARPLPNIDYKLISLFKLNTIYTNAIRTNIFDNINVENVVIPCN